MAKIEDLLKKESSEGKPQGDKNPSGVTFFRSFKPNLNFLGRERKISFRNYFTQVREKVDIEDIKENLVSRGLAQEITEKEFLQGVNPQTESEEKEQPFRIGPDFGG